MSELFRFSPAVQEGRQAGASSRRTVGLVDHFVLLPAIRSGRRLLSFERFALASHRLDHCDGPHAPPLYAEDGDGGSSGEQPNPAAPYATLLQQQAALEALSLAEQEEEEGGGKRAASGTTAAPFDLPLFQPPSVCLCPLCRSNYQKRWMGN